MYSHQCAYVSQSIDEIVQVTDVISQVPDHRVDVPDFPFIKATDSCHFKEQPDKIKGVSVTKSSNMAHITAEEYSHLAVWQNYSSQAMGNMPIWRGCVIGEFNQKRKTGRSGVHLIIAGEEHILAVITFLYSYGQLSM